MLSKQSENSIILIADPKILAVPVVENHEAMINIAHQKAIAFGPPPLIPDNTDFTKMRNTVYEKLLQAQAILPDGLKLCLYEAYRGYDLQESIFQERYNALRVLNPHMSHEQLFIETTKFASPNINLDGSKNVPPHATGGAVDVYLLDHRGQVVDMGIHLDDTYQDIEGIYCKTDSHAITDEAKSYRKIMGDALSTVGFVNYPTEYWHWSYGDRYWAYHTHHPHAIYGAI